MSKSVWIENMIHRATEKLGETKYVGWCPSSGYCSRNRKGGNREY